MRPAGVRGHWLGVAIALCGLAAVVSFWLRPPQVVPTGDERDYFPAAVCLARSGVLSCAPLSVSVPPPDAYREPGYPFLLAAYWRLARMPLPEETPQIVDRRSGSRGARHRCGWRAPARGDGRGGRHRRPPRRREWAGEPRRGGPGRGEPGAAPGGAGAQFGGARGGAADARRLRAGCRRHPVEAEASEASEPAEPAEPSRSPAWLADSPRWRAAPASRSSRQGCWCSSWCQGASPCAGVP